MYYDCVAGAVGISCIYLYIYMFAHIEENIFKLADSAKIVLALLVFYFWLQDLEYLCLGDICMV